MMGERNFHSALSIRGIVVTWKVQRYELTTMFLRFEFQNNKVQAFTEILYIVILK